MAHMQMQLEKQVKKKSPIAEIVSVAVFPSVRLFSLWLSNRVIFDVSRLHVNSSWLQQLTWNWSKVIGQGLGWRIYFCWLHCMIGLGWDRVRLTRSVWPRWRAICFLVTLTSAYWQIRTCINGIITFGLAACFEPEFVMRIRHREWICNQVDVCYSIYLHVYSNCKHKKRCKGRPIMVWYYLCTYFQVGIPHFGDTSICRLSHKQLMVMGVGELQLIVNDLLSQIEGWLFRMLLIIFILKALKHFVHTRDELRMQVIIHINAHKRYIHCVSKKRPPLLLR